MSAGIDEAIERPPPHAESIDDQLRARVEELRGKLSFVRQRLASKEEALKRKNYQLKLLTDLRPLPLHIDFANLCLSHAEKLRAEVYICHGVQTLLAAMPLRAAMGGRVVCDVIDTPSFGDRALEPPWALPIRALLDASVREFLRNCDDIFTVSSPLAECLAGYGPRVHVFPNCHRRSSADSNDELRRRLGLAEGDKVIAAACTITHGLEDVVQALAALPENIHLVTIGKTKPESYQEKISSLVHALKLDGRYHALGKVPFEEFHGLLSGADMGIVVLTHDILNHRVSLPNRVFDYLSSGVPFCSPKIAAIEELITRFGIGMITECSPQGWRDSIVGMMDNIEQFRENVAAAAEQFSWEAMEDSFCKSLEGARSVTFLGHSDLRQNQRTLRMARTLSARNIQVTFCCRGQDSARQPEPNAAYSELIFGKLALMTE
jgi:glycosyltransferase involved in cell wall biosynthesis